MKEKDYKKINANWLRKIGFVFTTLAAVILSAFVLYSSLKRGAKPLITGIPNTAMYTLFGALMLCNAIALFVQALSIIKNKIILSEAGIEIKKLLKNTFIPTADIIRIDNDYERLIGMPTQNRHVFKIITNTKTYEINSHEFLGLRKALSTWVQKYKTEGSKPKNEN